ncbi:ribosomal L7Ae/L30e/S12e/Gadd45 family protein [Candidatus Woesearchaeota archaeon]|nr:ribosomal L7Ae/L30e/S12e/Gadd45 family protein [Candidatus Woesearchaeota archaeon]
MAQETTGLVDELKRHLEEGRAVIGTKQTRSALQRNRLSHVVLSSNCPAAVVQDLSRLAGFAKVPVDTLAVPNTELGIICRKQFSISVLGFLNEDKN